MNSIKLRLKNWLPPSLMYAVGNLRKRGIRFEGNYSTWAQAAALCTGYDADSILEKVLEASLKVRRGEVAFERDSVLFDKIEYSWPVTAALMSVAARNGGELHVLDFGGSLGSSYFQNRKFLSSLHRVSWSVVEQNKFVTAGKKYLTDDLLDFYYNIESCCAANRPNVVLMSSVLQYLEEPFSVLKTLSKTEVSTIVIDRVPFLKNGSSSSVKIQHVPAEIYVANYPCWFFSRNEFIREMSDLNYDIVEQFDSLDKLSNKATWQGLIFEKVKQL